MTSPNGQFLDLNAQQRLVKRHPNVHKLRPGVVRRTHPEPEPDRSLVEGFVAKGAQAQTAANAVLEEHARESEPEPVAAKKKARNRLSDGDKKVAIARVNSLVKAGEEIGKACKSVSKEFGVSPLSLKNWRLAARENGASEPVAAKPAKKRASKKQDAAPAAPVARDALATEVLSAFAAWLDAGVREVVRQEIRRMLA